ncbi:MAG: hypothetical protein WC384_01555 [Prolixibacteraceae bacterium]|jgi:hypothetical protein
MKLLSIIKYFLVLFLFAGMGCEEVTIDKAFTLGNETTFRMNQVYYSADGQYSLKITDINDSRCPEGVVCFWAGEVTVKGEWTENDNKSAFELHSVLSELQKQPDGFTIQLIDAKPYPKYGAGSNPEDLVITLLITKN